MTKNQAVIFCRVSSKEQEETGYSLPSQEKYLKEYCERKLFLIAKVFAISESASGKKQRGNFLAMMNFVKKEKIKLIVCEKVDRLTRNFKDMVLIDEWLETDEARQIHLVKDSLVLHKNSRSQEKLNWGIRILFAKNYTDNLSEEIKKGYREKLAQGWLPSKALPGYMTIGEKRHKTQILNPEEAPLVKKMFELYASGNYTLKMLTALMKKEGLRRRGHPIGLSRIHTLLQNPFYYGKIVWRGELYEGKHEPLITKALFDEVQKRMKRQSPKDLRYRKHLPVFKAKIRCTECGCLITWERQKGHWYGHCTGHRPCSQKKYTRQRDVEKQLFPWLTESWFDQNEAHQKIYQWLEKALKEKHQDETKLAGVKRTSLERALQKIDRRLVAIYEDKIDRTITLEFYDQKRKEYEQEKNNLETELANLGKDKSAHYQAGLKLYELMHNAKAIYRSKKATNDDRRLLLSYIFSNLELLNEKLAPTYTGAFGFLLEWVPIEIPISEPADLLQANEKTAPSEAAFPRWYAVQDSNL